MAFISDIFVNGIPLRRRRMTEYVDWSKLPSWVNYVAVDNDGGGVAWFETEPVIYKNYWQPQIFGAGDWESSHNEYNIGKLPYWKDSLRKRPVNGGNMDKQEAMKRLDAIEDEAKKLREIIEKGDKIVYDNDKIYVGVYDGLPYIMAGYYETGNAYFRFHSLETTLYGWEAPKKSGQECINYHLGNGFKIHVFDDTREAIQFFLDNL